jgi:Ssp1 endopeptidase immunity protein Rap1a
LIIQYPRDPWDRFDRVISEGAIRPEISRHPVNRSRIEPMTHDPHLNGLAGGGLAIGLCLLALVSTPAAAYFDTGNQVYERCIAPDKTSKRQICLATASAYLDMMRALGYTCTDDKLTRRQIADVFAKFLRENPESRQKSGPSLAIEAFSKGFGCKKQ